MDSGFSLLLKEAMLITKSTTEDTFANMLDHLLIYTPPDLISETVKFYLAALAPLGYKQMKEYADGAIVGMGDGTGHPDFWVATAGIKQDQNFQTGYAHFAFRAKGMLVPFSLDLPAQPRLQGLQKLPCC